MNLIPGLSLRAKEEAEIDGIDDHELGEFAYDYVEHRREIPYAPSITGQEPKTSGSLTPEQRVTTKQG